ncbi:unnamed protein product [Echinostoma caproni]|uniref:Uncharacterized protein n=1 Tax=Echinostoma caproni TaxID=27848 RepID=A0A3P8HV00_9TREM|nr:unnamed protein product [Echinostoma caproni]
MYDKDVFGGKIDQYVDVTHFTAHRIRLEEVEWLDSGGSLMSTRQVTNPDAVAPSRLLLIGPQPRASAEDRFDRDWSGPNNQTHLQSIRAWIVGQRAGRMRIRLVPIDRARLKASMPPGLVKQLKDQKSELIDPTDVDSFGDDSLWAGSVKDEPIVDLVVHDEPGTWPVGMSAQIVTGEGSHLTHNYL